MRGRFSPEPSVTVTIRRRDIWRATLGQWIATLANVRPRQSPLVFALDRETPDPWLVTPGYALNLHTAAWYAYHGDPQTRRPCTITFTVSHSPPPASPDSESWTLERAPSPQSPCSCSSRIHW